MLQHKAQILNRRYRLMLYVFQVLYVLRHFLCSVKNDENMKQNFIELGNALS